MEVTAWVLALAAAVMEPSVSALAAAVMQVLTSAVGMAPLASAAAADPSALVSLEELAAPAMTSICVSSRELGLGSNFGLDAPDNVLSRAARMKTSAVTPGIAGPIVDRPSLKGLDLGTTGDGQHSSQNAKGSQASSAGAKTNASKKKEGEQAGRSEAANLEEQLLLQQQLAAQRAADLPPTPSPSSPTASTTPVPSPAAPALPNVSPVVTTTFGSGEVAMIGAYFAQHGAPVASIPTSSVNVSVGGTVPDSVALFPPPYDLVSQVSDPDFLYFV